MTDPIKRGPCRHDRGRRRAIVRAMTAATSRAQPEARDGVRGRFFGLGYLDLSDFLNNAPADEIERAEKLLGIQR